MKVYEIATGYTPVPARISAATETVVTELAKALIRLGQDAAIVDIRSENRPDLGVPVVEVPVPRRFIGTDVSLGLGHKLRRVTYSLALAGVLQEILRQTDGPVLFHFHNQYNYFFFHILTPARLRSRCFTVYTNHSGIWRQDWRRISSDLRLRYFQELFSMKRSDLVCLLNPETLRNIRDHLGVPEARLAVVPNGVCGETYRPLPEQQREQALGEFGFTGRTVILQVGSVCENKGQLRVLEALHPLLEQRKELVYAYAGGIVEEDYQQQINRYCVEAGIAGQVRYLGMIPPGQALNRLYNTAAATVLASRYEAFGLAAVESLAAGVPVFLPEDSPLDFGPGCLRYSQGQLAQALSHFLHSHEAPAANARANALANYSWESAARQYIQAWTQRMEDHG